MILLAAQGVDIDVELVADGPERHLAALAISRVDVLGEDGGAEDDPMPGAGGYLGSRCRRMERRQSATSPAPKRRMPEMPRNAASWSCGAPTMVRITKTAMPIDMRPAMKKARVSVSIL